LLALLLLVTGGCTTVCNEEEQLTDFIRACSIKEKLKGLPKEEILSRFGEPDFVKTSSVYDNRKDIWRYINMYGKIKITFINDVVMEFEYD